MVAIFYLLKIGLNIFIVIKFKFNFLKTFVIRFPSEEKNVSISLPFGAWLDFVYGV